MIKMDANQVVAMIDLPPYDGTINAEELVGEVLGELFCEALHHGSELISLDVERIIELKGFLHQHRGQKNEHLDAWRDEMRKLILDAVVKSFYETCPRIRKADITKINYFEDLVKLTGEASYGDVDEGVEVVAFEFRDVPRGADGSYSAANIREFLEDVEAEEQQERATQAELRIG